MGALSLLLEAAGLLGFTWWLLGRYRDPHVSPVALATVFLSWTLGFFGLLLLPIDMARRGHTTALTVTSDVVDNEPIDGFEDNRAAQQDDLAALLPVWQALYWVTFALSWWLLPFLVEFCQNGEFEFKRRVLASLRGLILHWTVVAVVAAAVMIYLLFVGHFTALGGLGLAMAAANTYGLVWLIALLGYGLVDVPRSLWLLRQPEMRLRALFFRATQVYTERMEAIFLYEDVVRDVRVCYSRMLQAESASIILTSEMQEAKSCIALVMVLVQSDHKEHERKAKAGAGGFALAKSSMLSTSTLGTSNEPPTMHEVVELHRRVKAAQADLRGSEQAWLELCIQAETLQTRVHTSDRAKPPVGLHSTSNVVGQMRSFASNTSLQLKRALYPPLWAAGAVVATFGSLCVLWGELTMAWPPRFSLFQLLAAWGLLREQSSTEMLVFVLLLYMVFCAYSSLFKLRSFGRFALRGHGNSSELALLRTAIHQCRLQFALSYNFLLLVHQPALTDATAFHRLWRHMQVIHVFGRDFSVYAPVLMVVLVACTAAHVYARLMKHVVGMEQYEQLLPGHADHEAQVAKGEQLIHKGLEKYRRDMARKQAEWRDAGFAAHGFAQSLLDGDDDHDRPNADAGLEATMLVA